MNLATGDCTRRQWWTAAARYAALGGIVAGSAAMVWRNGGRPGGGCHRPIACRDCAAAPKCRLARAAAEREAATPRRPPAPPTSEGTP